MKKQCSRQEQKKGKTHKNKKISGQEREKNAERETSQWAKRKKKKDEKNFEEERLRLREGQADKWLCLNVKSLLGFE